MRAQPQRHYFHGDIVDESTDNPNAMHALRAWPGQMIVFCARCDMFEPADVVRAHPPEMRAKRRGMKIIEEPFDGPARLAFDRRRWAGKQRNTRGAWQRPADARSIFDAWE